MTLPGGALWQADNVVLTRGNELQKRRAFVPVYALPAGTVGLATSAANAFVFGTPAAPAGIPAGIIYQRLDPGGGLSVTAIEDYTLFEGKLYVSARLSDGTVRHFYDGALVAGWTPVALLATRKPTHSYSIDPVPPAAAPRGFYGTAGSPVLTLGRRVYAGYNRVLFFSALGQPTVWDPADQSNPGAGFIEMGSNWGTDEAILALEVYQGNLAVFLRDTIQIWRPDPDPDAFQLVQVLPRIGTMAPLSVRCFSDADVFFLSDSGLRSLRARANTDSATTGDIGTPIDSLLRDLQAAKPDRARLGRAQIEPANGRYWLAIDNEIFVFSFYPSAKVSAWTRLLPGWPVDELDVLGNTLLLRSGNQIYAYDGTGGAYGDDYLCEVVLPMLDGDAPAAMKTMTGMDAAAQGVWAVELGTDPANPDVRERVATIWQPTYGQLALPIAGQGTHFGFRFTHQAPGPAGLASVMLHFEKGEVT